MYEERPSRIPGAFVWSSTSDGLETRVLPDGCLDLLWTGGTVTVAGPDTTAGLHRSPVGTHTTGLRFAPGFGPQVLGLPAAELTDDHVPLDRVWTASQVEALVEQLAGAADPGAALEEVALATARRRPDPGQALVDHVVRRIRADVPVAAIAAEVGLSSRQLHRRSLDAFGYGPKLLARILRLQRAVALARAGHPFAEVAAVTGYADQAHLARNVKELAGVPLGQLVVPSP